MKSFYFLLSLLSLTATTFSQNLTEHLIESGQAYDARVVHSADMDNDGDKDLFSVQSLNNIDWYENLGGGNFSFQHLITTKARGATDVHTGDFDQDGDLDVVSSSSTDDKIAWYENLGNGLFSNGFFVDTTLLQASDVETDDVDNDGKTDIIAAGLFSDEIVWYRNLGNNQFSSKIVITTFNSVKGLKMGDIDQDGFDDILAFTSASYNVIWCKNNGNGTYSYQGTVNNSSPVTTAILLTDATGDGFLDIVIANSTDLKIYSYFNGIFINPRIIAYNNQVQSMASSDVDNDGDFDIVYGNNPGVGLFVNDGTGNYTGQSIENSIVYSVNAEDYNLDGKIDLVYADPSANRLNFLKGLGANNYAPFKTLSSKLQDMINSTTPVDLDSDGDLDVVATSNSSTGDPLRVDENKLSWYENTGNGQFSAQKVIAYEDSLPNPGYFNTGDYDNDGDIDILALNNQYGFADFLMNNGNEVFIKRPGMRLGNNFEVILDYDTGDIDNDGDLDVVANIEDFNLSYIAWYENLGNGVFNVIQVIDNNTTAIGGYAALELRDVDLDGNLDLNASLYYLDQVTLYMNLGNGVFDSPVVVNSGSNTSISILFDVDNDSDLDVFSVSTFDNKVFWQRKTGLNLSAEISIDANIVNPLGLQIGDFDGDGLEDLIVTQSNQIVWYKNLGGGNFSGRMQVIDLFPGASSSLLIDINNDARLDFFVAELYHAKISWFENVGSACVTNVVQLNDSICQGSSYTFNGENLFDAGTYVDTLLTTQFCDSVVILNLRFKTAGCIVASCNELYISEYQRGSSFNKALEIYNPTNDDIDLSSYTLDLYVNGSQTVTNSIPLSGIIYADSTFVIAHPTADPAILSFTDLQTSVLNYTGDDAIALTKNGNNIDVIGQIGVDPGTAWSDSGISTTGMTLVRKYTNTSGNTSNSAYVPSLYFDALPLDDFTNLKMHSSECQLTLCNTDSIIAVSICSGSTYVFNGTPYTSAGVYVDTIPNAALCDSIITLNLSVNSSLNFVDATICSNETYPFNNQNLSVAGTYFDTLTNVYGCDSVVKLTLQTYPSVTYTLNQTLCFGESIDVNGTTYSSSVSGAIETFPNGGSNGCDSIVIINLTVLPMVAGTDVRNSCGPITWIDGITYTANNTTATHILPNASHLGCDSLVTLNLSIHGTTFGTDTQTACESFTWINGLTYTSDNTTATHTLVGGNSYGCDSIVTLNLTINLINSSIDQITACQSYTWMNGVTYTSNNSTASFTLPNATVTGCDSIIYLDLTILPVANGTDTQVSCGPFTWINGVNYTVSNTTAIHTIPGGAANGCDSIVHLNLTVNTVNSNITNNNNTLTSTVNGGVYQWIDCITNTAINGANSQVFTPTINGSYAVVVLKNNCVDTSACLVISNVGQEELNLGNQIALYPNPSSENTTIAWGDFTNMSIEVRDLSGKIIFSADQINSPSYLIPTAQFARGIYLIHVFNQELHKTIEFVKM